MKIIKQQCHKTLWIKATVLVMIENPKAVVWRQGSWRFLLMYPIILNGQLILKWNLPSYVEQICRNYIHLFFNFGNCIILTIIFKL